MKLRNRQETQSMPSADNVAERPGAFRVDPATGLSEQRSGEVAKARRVGHLPYVAGGLATAVALGALYVGTRGGDKAPAERTDRVNEGTSQSTEPTPDTTQSPDTVPTQEVEPVELSYVTKAEYDKPAEAFLALEKQRAAFISGELLPSEWDEEDLHTLLIPIFGKNFDPESNIVKNTLDLFWRFNSSNEDLKFAYDHGDLDTLVQYRTTVKDIKVIGTEGNSVEHIPTYDVNTEEIPEVYRDEGLDIIPEISKYAATAVLAEEDGHWIIVGSR